jgi:hypothetical protein
MAVLPFNGLDVDPFVEVLLNGSDQNATRFTADMNSDGEVNGLDVDPFVAAVIGSGTQSVPEPSTLLLCILALSVVGVWRKCDPCAADNPPSRHRTYGRLWDPW